MSILFTIFAIEKGTKVQTNPQDPEGHNDNEIREHRTGDHES